MPEEIIFSQIPLELHRARAEGRVLHHVTVPSYGEPRWYVTMISLGAYQRGKRAGAGKLAKLQRRDRCSYNGAYMFYKTDQHELDQKHALMVQAGADPVKLAALTAATPHVHYASLWDFYAYIGFDRHKRRYSA